MIKYISLIRTPRVPGGKTVLALPLLESFAFLPPGTGKNLEEKV
jgi:hypothetical protein